MRQSEGLRDWLGSPKGEKRKKKDVKETRKKALLGQVCTIDRRGIGIIVSQVRGRGKETFLFIEKAIGNKISLDVRLLL